MPALTRRTFVSSLCAATALSARAAPDEFKLRYVLATPLYGYDPLAAILPEAAKTGTDSIDLWPKPHGNQREQLDEMGIERFQELLRAHTLKLGVITRYDLGPFKLQDELRLAARLGAKTIVCGSGGPKGLGGEALKEAVRVLCEKLKPVAAQAEEHNIQIAIENHRSSLLHEPDSLRWFRDGIRSPRIGIAYAPHHLPDDSTLQGSLITELGDKVAFFYAQQHGKGSTQKMPLDDELQQLPGRGPLDFAPLVAALKKIKFSGFTEIFMHPVPRGRKILDATPAVTDAINAARALLDGFART